MFTFSGQQIELMAMRATIQNVDRLERFMLCAEVSRFNELTPNLRRELVIRAVQRAAGFGCHSAIAAAKVLVLMCLCGLNFDLMRRAQGGVFDNPSQVDGTALNEAFERIIHSKGLSPKFGVAPVAQPGAQADA